MSDSKEDVPVNTGTNDDNEDETDDELVETEETKAKREQESIAQRKRDTSQIVNGGNFKIQVHIIQCRDLIGKDFTTNKSDSMIKITINKKTKTTAIIKSTKNPYYDEIFYFELNDLMSNELENISCLVECFDADILSKNDLIGFFNFGLSEIYYNKYHEIYEQWLCLTNDEDNDKICGYMQLSIVVLAPNDEQYIHKDNERKEFSDDMVLVSPRIKQTPYNIYINVYDLFNLPKLDSQSGLDKLGKKLFKKKDYLDPYIIVSFAGNQIKSKIYMNSIPMNMSMNCQFIIAINEPIFSKNICLDFIEYDKDPLKKDDRIGKVKLNYNDVKKGNLEPRYYYMYGSQHDKQRKKARLMNKGLHDIILILCFYIGIYCYNIW